MKPLYLSLEGFMPFKGRTEIDFSDLRLFAIQGATGSGKSSLLDAMTYALYGKTDRLGATGTEALISSGEDHFTVALTFAQGDEVYRAVRSRGRKATQTQVRLEKQVGERWQTLASGNKAAEAQIEALLGLDFQSFTRAIMLPQGKFNALLHGKKSDRQSLLGELAGLGHVAEMYKYASEQSRDLKAQLESEQGILAGEYAGVDAQALEALQAEARELALSLVHLADDRDSLQQQVSRLRTLQGVYQELQGVLGKQAEVQAQGSAVAAGALRAKRARSVAHILPLLDNVQAAQKLLKQSQQAYAQAQAAQQAAEERQTAQKAALDALHLAAQREQAEQTAQLERLEQLSQAAPLLKSLRQQQQASGRAAQALEQARKAEGQALQAHTQAEARLLEAQGEAAQIPTLESRAAELEQVGALARKLKQLGGTPQTSHAHPLEWDENEHFAAREAGRKLEEARRQLKLAEAAKASLEHQQQENRLALKAHVAEEKRLERLKQEGLDVKTQYEEARGRLYTSGLAQYHAALNVGEPCPLCGQTVHELPAAPQAGLAEELARLVEELEQQLTTKRSEFDNLRTSLRLEAKQLEEKRLELQAKVADNHTDLTTLQQEIALYNGDEPELAQRYLAGLASKVSGAGQDPLAERGQLLAQAAALREAAQQAQQTQAQAHSDLAAAQARLHSAQSAYQEREQEVQAAQEQLQQRLTELGLSAAELEAAPDPAAQRRTLQLQADARQRELQQAQTEYAAAQSSHAAAQATHTAALQTLQARQQEAGRAEQSLSALLSGMALDAAEVRAAALPEDEIAALEQRERQHQAQVEQLAAQRSQLEEKLGAAPFDPAALSQAERDLHAAETALGSARQRSGELSQAVSDLAARLERKRDLQAKTGARAQQLDTWATLSASLRTSEFQQFLLEDLESRLLEGAGALLHTISDGRYRLDLQGGEYMVQDLWNAGERRGVKTLSGGETFLASLALAITLSDYLAGSRVLGALFLDEGFGTLDPQALDSVAEALEGLQTQGRMVGVITHVETLSERLPSRLLVSKSVAGSSVTRIDE